MWTFRLLLSVVFTLAAGDTIYDVTTVYNVGNWCDDPAQELTPDYPGFFMSRPGTCFTEVSGRIHARTNALGLLLCDEDQNCVGSTDAQLPNITCDMSPGTNVCSWDTEEWKFSDELSHQQEWRIKEGTAYKYTETQTLAFEETSTIGKSKYLYFTSGPQSLSTEKINFLIKFHWRGYSSADIYYGCSSEANHGSEFSLQDRNGKKITVRCTNHYTNFGFNYDRREYVTFNFINGLQVYKGVDKYNVINWYNRDITKDIKYFSMSGDSLDEVNPVILISGLTAKEIGSEMVSPVFTPETNQLCLTLVFHYTASSPTSLQNQLESLLDILAEDLFMVRHTLQFIANVKEGWNVRRVNFNLENMSLGPIKLIIKSSWTPPSKLKIMRISSCRPDGQEVIKLSQIRVSSDDISKLKDNLSSSVLPVYTGFIGINNTEILQNQTNNCLNGGVLTFAGCACVPGFSGPLCETGCGRNRFGQDCGGRCSLRLEQCEGLLLCTEFTKCHCAPGYSGRDCTNRCPAGWYGNDCLQSCGQCATGTTCDIYTGECSACKTGYLLPHCTQASVYYASKPELASLDYGVVTVTFNPNNYIAVDGTPQLYQIQYRAKGDYWRIHTNKLVQKNADVTDEISENIEGLETGTVYQVRVLLMDADFVKYDGDLVQISEILTKCDIPKTYDYKVKSTVNTTSFTFSWTYINDSVFWCPVEKYEVSWKEDWKWLTDYSNENFTLTGFWPGSEIKFRVRAKTTGGFAPFSETVIASTLHNSSSFVRDLRFDYSESNSVKIAWNPPSDSDGRHLRYTVSYKCVDQPACSPGCQNATEGQLAQQETSVTLSPLLPFSQYLVTVTPEGGLGTSVYVGTNKVVPTEVPSLSPQGPIRSNTSLTVFWEQVPVCSSYLLGYNYQLLKESDSLKVLSSGFTKETSISFHNLTASTEYIVRVYVSTVAGWNPLLFLTINASTSATVPEAVRNLTVYKRGRGMLGLRWAEPRATYGSLKSFTVSYTLGKDLTRHTIEPTHCVVWPNLYCHVIEGLRSNRKYNVTVSARNSDVAEDGEGTAVTGITKESPPTAPESLKLINSSSTSVGLEWRYPDLANGVVRSFLVSVEETEKFDQDSCCQIYPLVETHVKEELQMYEAEVSGLHPASTYFVSVSAKTVGLGSSQTLVVYTRPPHLPLTSLPVVEVQSADELSWLAQEQLPELNNSDVYSSLIKTHLLLAVINKTQPLPDSVDSGILNTQLNSLLKQLIGKPFYFISEYSQEEPVVLSDPIEENDSVWGQTPSPFPLSTGQECQLVAAQVTEYNGVHNADLRFSVTFTY